MVRHRTDVTWLYLVVVGAKRVGTIMNEELSVGDSVMMRLNRWDADRKWERIGLVLGFARGMVLVFWGEDFPCEEEYCEQLIPI